ncbi:MAG: type II secretion system F family protein [Acidimicrobiales bacterium]
MSESFAEDRGFLVKVEGDARAGRVPLRPGEAMGLAVGILVSGALGMVLFGGSSAGSSAVIGAFVQIFVLRFKARRRMRQFEQQLPDALQLLAGTLRAGYSLPQGLEAVSHEISDPMGFELRRVMTEARLGRELEDALASAADRLSSPDFAWAVMAIAIQREVGGNLNELLMTVSDTMVQRERLKGEVAALTAEGKASTVLLGGMPPGLGLVMYIMNAEYMSLLFTETLGKIMLAGGLLLMAIGMAWMKKVMTINV